MGIESSITVNIGDNFTLSVEPESISQVRADGVVQFNNVTRLNATLRVTKGEQEVARSTVPAQGKVTLNVVQFAAGSGSYSITVHGEDEDGDQRHGRLELSVV